MSKVNDSSAVKEAFKDQGVQNTSYGYTDDWKHENLQKGDKIAQIEFRNKADLDSNKSLPNSTYFIKAEELDKFRDEKTGIIDARKLTEAVQVAPRYNTELGKAVYNPEVSIYEVQKEIKAATSTAENNITLGDGGAKQYRTELSAKGLKKGGHLERIEVEKTINNDHQLPVFKKIEQKIKDKGLTDPKNREQETQRREIVGRGVYTAQQATMKAMESSGHKPSVDKVNEVKALQNRSHIERGEPVPNKVATAKKSTSVNKTSSKSSTIER